MQDAGCRMQDAGCRMLLEGSGFNPVQADTAGVPH